MIILAIETATPIGSAALHANGKAAGERNWTGPSHSERLLPAIDELLREAGIKAQGLDAIAISIGPGSFTGLRTGFAVAKALAGSLNKPMLGVSTLEAFASHIAADPRAAGFAHVAPMLDARRSEVFAAVFAREASGAGGSMVRRVTEDVAESAESFAARIQAPTLAGGAGAVRYAETLHRNSAYAVALAGEDFAHPSAAAVARLAAAMLAEGRTADPLTLEPLYVRKADVELRGAGGA